MLTRGVRQMRWPQRIDALALDREGQASASVASEDRRRRRAASNKAGRLAAGSGQLASASVGSSARLSPPGLPHARSTMAGGGARLVTRRCGLMRRVSSVAGSRRRWLLVPGARGAALNCR